MVARAVGIVGFLGFGLLLLLGLNRISSASPPPEGRAFADLMRHAGEVEAITVGTSISVAVDFSALGVNGHHLWTPNSDLFEAAYVLRAAVPRLPRLRLVLISIMPVSLQWSSTARGDDDVRQSHYRITGGDQGAGLIDGDWRNLAVARLLPLVRYDHWKDVAGAVLVRLGVLDPRSYAPPGQADWWSAPVGSLDPRLRETDRQLVQMHVRAARDVGQGDPGASLRLMAEVRGMAEFLAARHIRAVFFTPPLSPGYSAAFAAARGVGVIDARQAMRELARRDGLTYVDLSDDPELTADETLFYGSHHLNTAGARAFSLRLARILAVDTAHAE